MQINTVLKYRLLVFLLVLMTGIPEFVLSQTNPPVITRNRNVQDRDRTREKLALSYYNSKDFEKAALVYEELFNKNPRQYYYNYLLNCLIQLKDFKKADKVVKQQLRIAPSNYRYQIDQIYVFDKMDNKRKADKLTRQILNNLPDNRNLIIQIATSFESKGYYSIALEVYGKAQMFPGNSNNYNLEKARVYQYTGDYEKMFDSYLRHLDMNPGDMQTIKNRMQSIMRQDVDDNLSMILKRKLLEKAQGDPDNIVYAEMLLWHVMQTKDYEMAYRQARAIDMRFENREEEMLELADICFANRNYEMSAKAYKYVKDKKESSPFYLDGYNGYYISLVRLAEADPATDEKTYRNLVKTGEKALEELGLNRATVGIAENLAHIKAFRLGAFEAASILLEEALTIGNLSKEEQSGLKLELADILLFREKVWDATLLYSQVENDMKNEPIGHEAKFRNARLFYFIGESNWSLAKLDILKSATSKLIANDAMELSLFIKDIMDEDTTGYVLQQFGTADLYAYRHLYDSAMLVMDSIGNQYSGFYTYQHLIYKKAMLFETAQQFEQADSLYSMLTANYPGSIKADNALFKRAELYRISIGDEAKAMELYMTLMRDYPDSIYAGESRKMYRMLRRDEEYVN